MESGDPPKVCPFGEMLRCCPPFRQTIQMRKKKEKKKKSKLKKNNDELKKKKRESCERNMTETHQTRQR